MPDPGALCVICRDASPDDVIAEGEQCWATGAALASGAAKIRYEIHGNTIAHLHLHVFPRYEGDPFTSRSIDGSSCRFHRSQTELAILAEAIRPALRR